MDTIIIHFLSALLGVLSLEAFNLYKVYASNGDFPKAYRSFRFWIVFFVVALSVGVIAVAVQVGSPLSAYMMGLSLPTLADRLISYSGKNEESITR